LIELENAGNTVRLLGTGCENGEQLVALKGGSLREGLPVQDQLAVLNYDGLAPQFFWSEATLNHLQGTALIDYTITEAELTAEVLLVQGCEVVNIGVTEIALADCFLDEVEISIAAGALSDEFGNTGPAVAMSQQILFDRVLPEASFASSVSDLVLGTHQVELMLSEPSTVDLSLIQLTVSSECSFQTEVSQSGYILSSSCGYGSFSYLVPVGSLVDLVGNVGPSQQLRFDFELIDPAPEIVEPEPAPEIVEPEPAEPQEIAPAPEIAQPEPEEIQELEPVPAPGNPQPETELAPAAPPVQEETGTQAPVQEASPIEPAPVLEPELVQEPEQTIEPPVQAEPKQEDTTPLVPEVFESALVEPREESAALEPEVIELVEVETDLNIETDQISEPNVVVVASPTDLGPEATPWFFAPWALALIVFALVAGVALFGYRLSGR
jgi:hypothetical protein